MALSVSSTHSVKNSVEVEFKTEVLVLDDANGFSVERRVTTTEEISVSSIHSVAVCRVGE